MWFALIIVRAGNIDVTNRIGRSPTFEVIAVHPADWHHRPMSVRLPNHYPADLARIITIDTHRSVRIRALRRCEVAPVRELVAQLSDRSRYQRFLSPVPFLSEDMARRLTCGDYQRNLALIAEYRFDTAHPAPVQLGRFGGRDDEKAHSEVAVGHGQHRR